MTREEAIKKFEKQLHSAMVVLDSGFGTSPGECDRVYRERKEMAEIALSALRPQETVTNRNGLNDPLTNAQKIRSMTDEELVNLHYSGSAHCIADDPTVCDRHDFIGNLTPCEQCYLKWLQQPAEEDDKNGV